MNRDPSWTFNFNVKKNEEILDRKSQTESEHHKMLAEKVMGKMKRTTLNVDLSNSYNNIINFRKVKIGFGKVN